MLDYFAQKPDHQDYEQIQRMAESFLHPKHSGVYVFEDVAESLHDYRMGHFLDADEHFEKGTAVLLYGRTQTVDHEERFVDFDNPNFNLH